MLADFQQALVDLTASPELCESVLADPAILQSRYRLTDREWHRLTEMVRHPGMRCACILYRANRLAPLALNLPELCRALGKDLRTVASEYWEAYPETNVHFFYEADRFCKFLSARIDEGRTFADEVNTALVREGALIAAALQASRIEAPFAHPEMSG